MGRVGAIGVCTGLICLAAAATANAAPRAPYFGPGGLAPRSPEIMLYISHSVGGGAGGGSMKPTFGLRVQQVRQGGNTGDPLEQGDSMQHRELVSWQMDAHSNMRLSQSRVKLGNRVTYDFAGSHFGSPAASVMQIGTPSLRSGASTPAQLKPFGAPTPGERFAAIIKNQASTHDNSSMRDLATAAVAALSPARFTSAQRQVAQRQGGLAAIAAAQRMQSTAALR